jgi:NADP-dependent 3-hydroxy acid dehydrogenase YdfG
MMAIILLKFDTNIIICEQSVSPGLVKTEIFKAGGYPEELQKEIAAGNLPILQGSDIANAVLYALSAPSNVQV